MVNEKQPGPGRDRAAKGEDSNVTLSISPQNGFVKAPAEESARCDIHEIAETLGELRQPGTVLELRVINAGRQNGVISGFFDSLMPMAQAAAELSGRVESVYITLNPVNPALLGRADNKCKPHAQYTSADTDILRRYWLMIDLDPIRPTGISSTDEEHDAALALAIRICEWLQDQGWPAPIVADSGNGAHLLSRIDLPNDTASSDLLSRVLQTLDLFFTDDVVAVDEKTFNPARLCKLYGTMACKGDSVPRLRRVHRLARRIYTPPVIEIVPLELLNQVANQYPA